MPKAIRLYKIFYDQASFEAINEPFIPLDNTQGKGFWYEAWPILRFLESNPLDDDTWYGFFSPKFPEKAGLVLRDITRVLEENPQSDVALFSYNWAALVTYRNVWTQGEAFHAGIIEATESFLCSQGAPTNLAHLITDLDNSVFSNYIVAKPRFWMSWGNVVRSYMNYVEGGAILDSRQVMHHKFDRYKLYTFVQERLASWLLYSGSWQVARPDYIRRARFIELPEGVDDRLARSLFAVAHRCKKLGQHRYFSTILLAWWLFSRLGVRRLRSVRNNRRFGG